MDGDAVGGHGVGQRGIPPTGIAACWRRGELYVLREVDGTEITEAQGRAICAERYKVTAEVRAARKRASTAQHLKKRAGRGSKESTLDVS